MKLDLTGTLAACGIAIARGGSVIRFFDATGAETELSCSSSRSGERHGLGPSDGFVFIVFAPSSRDKAFRAQRRALIGTEPMWEEQKIRYVIASPRFEVHDVYHVLSSEASSVTATPGSFSVELLDYRCRQLLKESHPVNQGDLLAAIQRWRAARGEN